MRRILLLAMLAVATIGSAQVKQYVIPHALERDGVVIGSAVAVTGGGRLAIPQSLRHGTLQRFAPVILSFYPDGNDGVIQQAVNDMMDLTSSGREWTSTQVGANWRGKRDFHEALITEVGFPALDQGGKDTAPLYCALSMESIGALYESSSTQRPKQKAWLSCNFRLKLGDLPCGRVSKIDSFTIKQGVTQDDVGEMRERTEMSDFSFDVPWADAAPFIEWFQMERDGRGVPLPMELMVYDGEKFCVGVSCMLNVREVGPVNLFDPIWLSPVAGGTLKIKGSPFGKSKELTGHVTLIK